MLPNSQDHQHFLGRAAVGIAAEDSGQGQHMTAKSWDDIDLDGLRMETPSDLPEGPYRQRQERLSAQDLSTIVVEQDKTIDVKIQNLTGNKEFTGIVLDISPGGAKLLTSMECRESEVLRISFRVGKRQIVCRAKVSWLKKEGQGCLAGVQFIAPKDTDVDFIKSLPAAKYLK